MHCLLMPIGSHGDVHPFAGLALALRERGHRVTVVSSGYFRELFERLDVEFVQIGTREEFLELTNNPDLWHPRKAFRHVFRAVAPHLRTAYGIVEERAVPGETVLVSNALGFAARTAAEKLGLPLVTVHLQPAVLWSDFASPQLPGMLVGPQTPRWLKRLQFWLGERFVIDRTVCPVLNPWRRELGLPPMNRTIRWWLSPERNLCLFPEWYAPRQPDWPANVVYAGFPLWDEDTHTEAQPEVEEFLDAGDPPIVFTPGSANQNAEQFFRVAVEACTRLGQRAMFLTKFPQQVPTSLPETMRCFEYVPFSRVFPRAATVVHHGGIGTTAQALRAKVPQLIWSLSHDQPDNAARLKRLGVGEELPPARFNPKNLETVLGRLASTAVATACATVADRLESGHVALAKACGVIEAFAAERDVADVAGIT